jgi:hypothetical protein
MINKQIKATRPENVQATIALFERVKARGDQVSLNVFQCTSLDALDAHDIHDDDIVPTEELAHQCGTAACVAGWTALDPHFHADGGAMDDIGAPYYPDRGYPYEQTAGETMSRYWGLPGDLCEVITATGNNKEDTCELYQVNEITYVTADHVISVLKGYL